MQKWRQANGFLEDKNCSTFFQMTQWSVVYVLLFSASAPQQILLSSNLAQLL